MNSHVSQMGHEAAPTFAQLWSPGLLLLLVAVGVLYTFAVGRWRDRFPDSEPVSLKKKLYFWTGIALWYIAEGTPVAYYGKHYLFSVHMFQQSILYLIMPPFFLVSLPGWLLRAGLKSKGSKRIVSALAHPLFALFFFNFIFSMYHIPMVMDWLMARETIMWLYKAVFLFAAFQMWFLIFCPLPEYNRLSDLKKIGYIFVNGILLTPACALIIFATHPMYEMYASVSEQYLLLPMLDDQQLGGVIMKIVQEIVYGVALAFCFYRWYNRERKKDEEEEIAFLQTAGNMNRA